jgi:hypothetical protein
MILTVVRTPPGQQEENRQLTGNNAATPWRLVGSIRRPSLTGGDRGNLDRL